MEREKFGLIAIAVFSAVMIMHRFLSLFEITDYVLLFYSALLTASFCTLLIKK
ncbi:MAG: hypothetical protein RMH75_04505 [Archaeoglobaceae archaeon]|nr:hypothetical protein [Archaeoglobaceae archaeon]MDW7989909.1 hypothetical protein [Archaeoglobaceae archaeon]